MCSNVKNNGIRFQLKRFWADTSGGVPIEVIALTGSLILLGITAIETQDTGIPASGTETSEEVFVRKCGEIVAGSDGPDLPDVAANNACR